MTQKDFLKLQRLSFKIKKIPAAEACIAKWSEIELYSPSLPPPYGFIKNLQQNHPRDSHMKLSGKNHTHVKKVGHTSEFLYSIY